MEPLTAFYYGKIDEKNPVVIAFENEIKEFKGFVKKIKNSRFSGKETYAKGFNMLFDIWNKYEPRLPVHFYHEKMMAIGDFLSQAKEYKLASFQCYGRYLQQFDYDNWEQITDVYQFKATFFPDGFEHENAGLTCRALQGQSICNYLMVKNDDLNLQNPESVKKCLSILSFFRLIMQVVLSQENLCWLVYNGSVHIYTICRHLMATGHAAKTLEYLLWASICMESSVPLLSVHYLKWRTTLYAAVCHCYYHCLAGVHAEVFARRALSKINELSQLEELSSSLKNEDKERIFREATAKMAVMVFKRAVFESRRKPKGYFRPKQRSTFKDMQNLPWPRNSVERLLTEMFDGSAVQFLAILEAISDSNRRILQTGPPAIDEPEVQDVILELFLAGLEILSGGGGNAEHDAQPAVHSDPIVAVTESKTLIQLVAAGEDGVSVEAAVKFAKLAFSYEQWDVFDIVTEPVFAFLGNLKDTIWRKAEAELKLLVALEPLVSERKVKHADIFTESNDQSAQGELLNSGKTISSSRDDLVIFAEILYSCVCTASKDLQPDKDMIADAVMFLWQKCRAAVQRVHMGTDYLKHFQKLESCGKWVHILWLIHEVIYTSNIGDSNPAVMAEIVLKLALILESIAESSIKSGKKSGQSRGRTADEGTDIQNEVISNIIKKTPTEQIFTAYKILEKAIYCLAVARGVTTVPDGSSVACSSLVNNLRDQESDGENKTTTTAQVSAGSPFTANTFIIDLHFELIVAWHRAAVKLLHLMNEADILKKINKNKLSKAMFLAQKALLASEKRQVNVPQKQLIEEAMALIQKAEAEENKLYSLNNQEDIAIKNKSTIPPAPILLHRSHCSMVFRPDFFSSKVSWYCIYGRAATGNNIKVRFSDCYLPGTGVQIPAAGKCFLKVEGLEPNEKYVFAVAAYSANGKLIGDSIGETTKPILAYPPLPPIHAWAYLTQVALQTACYPVAKKAFSVLWNHFVYTSSSAPENQFATSRRNRNDISQKRLQPEAVNQASHALLQLFLDAIFVICDVNIKEKGLFCDCLCDNGAPFKKQICRLDECERMLVALQLSNLLGDANYSLQAVVQCYGLLAPLMYYKLPSIPIIQILSKCVAVLQGLPSSVWQRRHSGVTEGIQHMIACTTYYMAKVLRSWEEYELCSAIVDTGKKLLFDISESVLSLAPTGQSKFNMNDGTVKAVEPEDERQTPSAKKTAKKKLPGVLEEVVNEQLKALEANMLKLTKPVSTTELTGQENPTVLYAVIECFPTKMAYKEVIKFKRRARFLEFHVQLIQKAVNEEKFDFVIEWTNEAQAWLKKRNENLSFSKTDTGKEEAEVTRAENERRGRAAAIVEYHKNADHNLRKKTKQEARTSQKNKANVKKYHATQQEIRKSTVNQRYLKKKKDEKEKKALETLRLLLTPLVSDFLKQRKQRRTYTEEMPWRCQMNLLLGTTHFILFQKKLKKHYKQRDQNLQKTESYECIDPEIFSLHNSGTIIKGVEVEAKDERNKIPQLLERLPKTHTGRRRRTTDSTESEDSGEDTPRTQTSSECSVENQDQEDVSNEILHDHLNKAFLHFKRALVLAHRGGHWTLFQNACYQLWNSACAVSLFSSTSQHTDGAFVVTTDLYNTLLCLPFFLASELILDMIIQLKNTVCDIKFVHPENTFGAPSCVGDITDEEGGSSLVFESPLDDVNILNLQWIRAMILRSMEILYHMKKWEALAYIAIQFNIITHERYAEQVVPLLVHAQRQLVETIDQLCGPKPPQPHMTEMNTNEKISCRNFIGKQLHVSTRSEEAINPGGHIDPEGHNVYSGGRIAKALVCVPLDVLDTLKCFRETLDKAQYYSRALRHSRKLLKLFLFHTQQGSDLLASKGSYHFSGRVRFSRGAALTQPPAPPDLSKEEFVSTGMIQNKAIPESQISIVISAYERTIELLQAKNKHGLRSQALHELGSLHYYAGHTRVAFKCWCQSLDAAMNCSDILNTWQELGTSSGMKTCCAAEEGSVDYSEVFLNQAGIWGCLHAAVLTAKIAQYILTSDIKLRNECCILSAFLFKALFRASLPHPKDDCDYAQYDIGEGYATTELIPGIDLFSDSYRADIRVVAANLSFLIQELYFAKQHLLVLPLLTLYQYFATTVCCDPHRSTEGRILKVKVLTELGMFTEGFYELTILLQGKKIPRKILGGYLPSHKNTTKWNFDDSKPPLDPRNVEALEGIISKDPVPTLTTLFDQSVVNRILLTKIQFLIKIASTISHIPKTANQTSHTNETDTTPVIEKDDRENIPDCGPVIKPAASEDPYMTADEKNNLKKSVPDVHSNDSRQLSMASLKDLLLSKAEEKLNLLIQDFEIENTDVCDATAMTLEVLIEAKLLLAAAVLQRQQAAFSTALVLSAIQHLQDAKIYFPKQKQIKHITSALRPTGQKNNGQSRRTDPDIDVGAHPHEVEAYGRLGIRLWMRCRLQLITTLTAHIPGVALIKGNKHTLNCSNLVREGIAEAEAFNDIEMQAMISLQAALLDLQEGRPRSGVVLLLKDLTELLQGRHFLSSSALLTLAQAMVQLADLRKIHTDNKKEYSEKQYLDCLISAQKIILEQLSLFGEVLTPQALDTVCASPVRPLKNIYFPHIHLLAEVKLRIGHAVALKAACSAEQEDASQWVQASDILNTALDLCRASAMKKLNVEAELLFQKGKLEHQLALKGNCDPSVAVETFLEAINVSRINDQNLWIIKKAYLEIALMHFHLANQVCRDSEQRSNSVEVIDRQQISAVAVKDAKRKVTAKVKPKQLTERTYKFEDMYKLQGCIAIKAAIQTSEAMVAFHMLTGQKKVTTYPLEDQIQKQVPDYVQMDLMASCKVFMLDKYHAAYVNMYESTKERQEAKPEHTSEFQEEETFANTVSADAQEEGYLTWVHIINYYTQLQRLRNVNTVSAASKQKHEKYHMEDMVHASIFSDGIVLRLTEMHQLLKNFLPAYAPCMADCPPKELYQNFEQPTIKVPVPSKSCLTINELRKQSSGGQQSLARSSRSTPISLQASPAPHSSEKELCIHWYCPAFLKPARDVEQQMVLLLFSCSTYGDNVTSMNTYEADDIICGQKWIPVARLLSLHERFTALNQQAELLQQMAKDLPSSTQSEKRKTSVQKSVTAIDSDKLQKGELVELQEQVKQCCAEIRDLLLSEQEATPITEIPFSLSINSLKKLEKVFDPFTGCILKGGKLTEWIISLLY